MGDPIEVAFSISADDLVEQVVLLTDRSAAVKARRRFGMAVALVLFALLGGYFAWEFGPWVAAPLFGLAAGYALLYDRLASFWTRRFARRFVAENPGLHATGARRLVLEGNSVRIETPTSSSTIRVEGPVRITEVDGFAHVELGGGEALFLPLRPAERGDPRAFVEALRARATAGAARA
jgi:hypothetical protein